MYVEANKILASIVHSEVLDPTHLSETLVHDLLPAETSTMAPLTVTPVATSITAAPVAPQTTLPTNAMGSPPHLTKVSRPECILFLSLLKFSSIMLMCCNAELRCLAIAGN